MKTANQPVSSPKNRCLWIDLDNTPHVLFFEPILVELKKRGYEVLLTAREAFQVCELADKKGLSYHKVGRHHGKNKFIKVLGLFYRAGQLLPLARKFKPVLAVSHGSRSQIIASNLLGITTVLIADYEFAKALPFMKPTWEFVPEVIPDDAAYCRRDHVRKYPGIKEDVYVPSFQPDPSIIQELGLQPDKVLATVRPPATEAHYHNPEAEILFETFMERAVLDGAVQSVILPRNKKQGEEITGRYPHWFRNSRAIIPAKAIDGLNLIWHSDLVVSGGGTMNREAAALGVPVYSIFRGPTGAVDKHLSATGRLIMIQNVDEAKNKIAIQKRPRKAFQAHARSAALDSILTQLEKIISDL